MIPVVVLLYWFGAPIMLGRLCFSPKYLRDKHHQMKKLSNKKVQ